jgi:hypothetical protein
MSDDAGLHTLSVRQPWAFEIILGRKDVENRNWKPRLATPFRLNIHAGKVFDDDAYRLYRRGLLTREQCAHRMGALVGIVTVAQIHDGYRCGGKCSPWADTVFARWHWCLSNAHAIDPIPMRGRLGMWEVPADTWGEP